MSDETQDLDELSFLAEDGRRRRDPEEHPSPEELSAYQANELTSEEDERIQDHIAVCQHCTELLLDLEEFLKPPAAAAEPVADFEAAADWKRLRERMELAQTGQNSILPLVARRGFFASAQGGYSVAVVFLAVTVGLGIWSADLARERRKPQPISEERTLFSQGSSRGSGKIVENEPVILPTQITLILPTEAPASLYRVDFLSQGRHRPEWSIEARPKQEYLNFLLPEKALSPGSYTLRVTPLRQVRSPREVWNYELRVSQPAH